MEYSYVAYTEDKKLIKGRISAANNEMAMNLLGYGGYQVVSLKPAGGAGISLGSLERFNISLSKVKPTEVVMLARQLALLLESGTDIVTAIDLLQAQTTNKMMGKALTQVATDIRGGNSLSASLARHPRVFSKVFCQAIAAGEQGGSLETVLRQMSDYIERAANAEKKIKSAMTYPIIVLVVAFIVIAIMIVFVFPTFTQLYTSFGAKLPGITQLMLNGMKWLTRWGPWLLLAVVAAVGALIAYIRTPAGKLQFHAALLKAPVIGRIVLLGELARACRTISLLFKVGVPIPEIMNMVVQGASNRVVANNLAEVREELIRGEGMFKPMSRRPLFLPLMVQMTGVGEETGNLDNTLATVARAYEDEGDEKTSSAIGMIQPIITVVMGLFIALIALSLISAMYGIYGQI